MIRRSDYILLLVILCAGCKSDPNTILDTVCDDSGCISLQKFSDNIHSQMEGKVVGYTSTVGALAEIVEYGQSRTIADPPSGDYTTHVKTNVASVSKMLTTIAVLQSLARNNLTIDSSIEPFLPDDWVRGPNIDTITFRELLTHRSGFRASGLNYAMMQSQIATGVVLSDKLTPSYNNLNFSILRVLLPYVEGFTEPGAAERDQATSAFYIEYMRENVFEPAGVTDADCKPLANTAPALYYAVPPGNTKGIEAGDWTLICGGGGWVLSAADLYKVLLSLVSDSETLLTSAQKQDMNTLCLGWDCSVQQQTNFVGKNGLLFYGDPQNPVAMESFVGIFKGKVPVVVLTNSNPGANITAIVAGAFAGATVPKP
jgi:CubicO group peptidase (beta-lactamase class C family)